MQVNEADHVEAVVLERGLEVSARAGAEVVEVGVGHHGARQRIVAFVAKHALLDQAERAAFKAMPVKSADQGQQVDVRRMRELAGHARHDPPRAQHRQVD